MAEEGREGQMIGSRKEGGGGGALINFVSIGFRARRAPQINLGRLETYRSSGRLVIALLQGCIRVMRF